MSSHDSLQTLLQNYCADDLLPVTHLPAILAALPAARIDSSPHLAKWLTRVNALIQSRDQGVRWAGLCLALSTARISQETLLSSGQGWVAVALPLLSVRGRLVRLDNM